MNTEKVFQGALLSEASYANLQNKFTSDDVKTALITKGFSQTQAQDFVSQWRVLDHRTNTASGFSATLFENISTGEKMLAVRGTDELIDWRTNLIDVGFAGTAQNQQQYKELRDFYNGLVADNKLVSGEQVNLAGHSLGGFLAQAFAVQYASRASDTTTYNALGFGGVVAPILRALGIYIYGGSSINVPNLTNLLAEAGPDFVARRGTLLGSV